MEQSDGDFEDLQSITRCLLLGGWGISRSLTSNVRLRFVRWKEVNRRCGGGVAMWYEAGRDDGRGVGLNGECGFDALDSEDSRCAELDSKLEKFNELRPTPWSVSEMFVLSGGHELRKETWMMLCPSPMFEVLSMRKGSVQCA